jgi:hypothetical protein
MAKSTNIVRQKKVGRGRPTEIGADKAVGIRLSEALLKQIDGWAKREKIDQRSTAIRKLIERGLEK